jgi:hypothetical protein
MKRTNNGKPKPKVPQTGTNTEATRVPNLTSTPSSEPQRRKLVYKIIGSSDAEATTDSPNLCGYLDVNNPSTANEENDPSGAVRNGWYAERYQPDIITGCNSSCAVCGGKEDRIAT